MRACAAIPVIVVPSCQLSRRVGLKYEMSVFVAEIIIRTKLSAVYSHKIPGKRRCLRVLFRDHEQRLIINGEQKRIIETVRHFRRDRKTDPSLRQTDHDILHFLPRKYQDRAVLLRPDPRPELIIHSVRCNILDHNVYLNSFSITYA